MRLLAFMRDMTRNYPWLLLANALLVFASTLVDASAVITLAPVVSTIKT